MLLIDTRERASMVKPIMDYFDSKGVEYERCKLYFGDFMIYENPHLVIDRKRTIQELADNVTTDSDRFKRELERVKATNSRMIILVEQAAYTVTGSATNTRKIQIKSLDDLYLWKHPKALIYGDYVARILYSFMKRYPIEVRFCTKNKTGETILQILNGENQDGKS